MVFEEVENAGVVSLDQLNEWYISTIEQSHTADRFIGDLSYLIAILIGFSSTSLGWTQRIR
jgi:hypothetical protein